jgi:hypothetical protein
MREKYFTFFTLAPDWLEGSLAAILLLDSRLAEGHSDFDPILLPPVRAINFNF